MIQRALFRASRVTRPHTTASAVRIPHWRSSPLLAQRQRIPPHLSIASRCYSATTETESGDKGGASPAEATSSEEDVAGLNDPLKAELEAKSKEVVDLKDKYLRSVADFRNLQDRTQRDVQAARDFAIQRFAKDLIDSVDNLDRALGTVPAEALQPPSGEPSKDLVSLYDGLKMTETILLQTLGKHGLQRFDPSVEGERFNPNLHEATFQTPVEGKEDGVVVHTQQKGYTLNGRVLRAAKVGVVKNS